MIRGRKSPGTDNLYEQLIQKVFFSRYHPGQKEVEFERTDIEKAAEQLGIRIPKNLGDLIYSFRYRTELPETIRRLAPAGRHWVIRPAGRSRYCFEVVTIAVITPNSVLAETKIPDATPGIIDMYALSDEQALLAKLRYNRLVDVFTSLTCYPLQSHLRTSIARVGQVETDEIYVGIDRKGVHYVLPVQAKGARDHVSTVQIEQDLAMCRTKFPSLICLPLAAQFTGDALIAMFLMEEDGTSDHDIRVVAEKHYRLVAPEEVSDADLAAYQKRATDV